MGHPCFSTYQFNFTIINHKPSMKIGLVRHFKVNHPFPKKWLISHPELVTWFAEYDQAEVEATPIDPLGDWNYCYTSSATRAIKTARHIFAGDITEVDALKEADLLPLLNKDFRLPMLVWATIARLSFSFPNDIRKNFKRGISDFVDNLLINHDQNGLIVSHRLVMACLQDELRKRGFEGNGFSSPEYGKVYILEKKDRIE